MFAISHVNLLTLMKAAPSPSPIAATGFPATNLYRGWPWRPFRFSATGVQIVDFETSIIEEDFNSAFVGGLPPGSYWSKTAGATCTRNTTDQFEGSGCMAVAGATNLDYVALNFSWPAGAIFAWSIYLRTQSTGSIYTGARVELIDLDSNQSLNGAKDPEWREIGAATLASNFNTVWVESISGARINAPSIVGGALAHMQLRFYAPGSGLTALYDIVRSWPEPDCMAVIGSNLPPSSNATATKEGGIQWAVGFGETQSTRFALEAPRPTSWALASTGSETRRTSGGHVARLSIPRPPVSTPVSLGWVWMGALTTLPEGPEYPINIREMFPQERGGGGGYESQAVRRGDYAPRRLEFSVSGVSTDRVEEVLAALRHARYGTEKCLLIAPYKNVDTAFYGRFLGPDGVQTNQGSFNSVRAPIIFEEEPFFRFAP